jgi:hypothetical protein
MPLFERNPAEAKTNLAKHRVDFEVAKDVFLDQAGLIEMDEGDPEEQRWRRIGRAGGRLLFVVFTEPDDDCHPHHLGTRSEQA